jgi:hypothetical protein
MSEETEGSVQPRADDDWEPAVRPAHAGDKVPGLETEESEEEGSEGEGSGGEGSESSEATEGSAGSGDSEEGTPGATEPSS